MDESFFCLQVPNGEMLPENQDEVLNNLQHQTDDRVIRILKRVNQYKEAMADTRAF